MRRITQSELMQKFMEKVSIDEKTGCWIWTGMINMFGYGIIKYKSLPPKMKTAHRASYFLHHGEFDFKLNVLHKCDLPVCVNPDHLFLGTHQDNMDDRQRKGRTVTQRFKGSECGASKLNEAQVIQIRSMAGQKRQRQIADMFNITQSSVHHILVRKTWTHI